MNQEIKTAPHVNNNTENPKKIEQCLQILRENGFNLQTYKHFQTGKV